MKMFYITLNNAQEAQQLSHLLLKQQLAVCTNWVAIDCAYRWHGEIKQDKEVVLIVKTQNNMRTAIEAAAATLIKYTHYIAELDVHSVNTAFLQWLNSEVRGVS